MFRENFLFPGNATLDLRFMQYNETYWSNRYRQEDTPWDAGAVTTPLKAFFDGLSNKDLRILVPGGGSGHEAAYLHALGFKEVYLLDFSAEPLQQFAKKYPDFPSAHLLQENFFTLKGSFDLIVEQTFFCALEPSLRPAYAKKMLQLLKPGGHLVGVLFDAPLNDDHPPFGGNKEEYLTYFQPYFTIHQLERCYNSIPPRAGRELWIDLVKE